MEVPSIPNSRRAITARRRRRGRTAAVLASIALVLAVLAVLKLALLVSMLGAVVAITGAATELTLLTLLLLAPRLDRQPLEPQSPSRPVRTHHLPRRPHPQRRYRALKPFARCVPVRLLNPQSEIRNPKSQQPRALPPGRASVFFSPPSTHSPTQPPHARPHGDRA